MIGLGDGTGPMQVEDIKIVQDTSASRAEQEANRYIAQGYGILSIDLTEREGSSYPTLTIILGKP